MGGFGQLYREKEAEYVTKLVSENQYLVREKSVKSQGKIQVWIDAQVI